ncbi:hypothetical protein JCM33374_g3681 [Metschnikowia sp. JCM 33374]|nr:hypothetical protein JCM33374_g3681 [Metschnikowia sp. JCM 33374]
MTDIASDVFPAMNDTEFEKVYQRMLELESELIEFQESSKDLEQALEAELQELEAQRSSLITQLKSKDKMISTLNARVIALNAEVTDLSNIVVENKATYEKTTADLKHKLVAMEISNDDILSRDRVVEDKLHLSNQFNNELLEKLAMVENDLDLERQANAQHKLTISNLSNTAAHQPGRLTRNKRDSTYRDFAFAESTILDINEMLATGPPAPVVESKMPRSESLTRFQELCSKSDVLRQKVGEVNSSLALKSHPTSELSRPTSTLFPSEASTTFASSITTDARKVTGEIYAKQRDRGSAETAKNGTLIRLSSGRPEDTKSSRKESLSSSEIRTRSSRKSKLRSVMKNFLP